uniref:G-protein coupled receptors family 1 profile domain-containing protein n=1 Tax=Erpetoichthys calabaricus TaxID=27687 RepID=A0A8C4RLM1_ERPCA
YHVNHTVNITCDENKRSPTINVILYVFFMAGVLLTVFGNLFVIISISHFKQLHTPTNFLVLSLATADFLIGLFVMPVSMIRTIEVCWTFGPTVCFCHIFLDSALSTASVFHLLFIAIDRYYAVCHPLLYTTKITAGVSLVFIAISWLWPMLYTFIYLHTQLNIIVNNKNEHCDGLCLSFVDQVWGTLDLLVSFLIPCTVMLSLYAKVFTVARHHARALRCLTDHGCSKEQKKSKGLPSRDKKATKTLGIVMGVFVFCWLPYSINNIFGFLWLGYLNSGLNPIIYALFYPWFRRSLKQIVTLKIFIPGSSLINLVTEKTKSHLFSEAKLHLH